MESRSTSQLLDYLWRVACTRGQPLVVHVLVWGAAAPSQWVYGVVLAGVFGSAKGADTNTPLTRQSTKVAWPVHGPTSRTQLRHKVKDSAADETRNKSGRLNHEANNLMDRIEVHVTFGPQKRKWRCLHADTGPYDWGLLESGTRSFTQSVEQGWWDEEIGSWLASYCR